METHEPDPRADPWERFQDELGELGRRLRVTYSRVADEGGPGEDEIKQALGTLAGAWNQVAGSVSTALQDPEVRLRVREAAAALASALGRTITDLGTELRDEMWRPAPPNGTADESEAARRDAAG